QILDYLNAKHFNDPLPAELQDVFEEEEYKKSQRYKKERYKFGIITSLISLIATLLFFFFDGFAFVDNLARSVSSNEIIIALVFFGIIMIASDILSTPFSYYSTFVIEENYGFNKTTRKTFFLDKLKGWFMGAVLGAIILGAIICFYQSTDNSFCLYACGTISVFTFLMNIFYARFIVHIFNKQTPLDEGPLRSQIEMYAVKVGFTLDKIFVIDGSKRSIKANAYFSGFGSEKRVTLYDTLIKDLNEEEIVAVLAHEVGHYKRNHIIVNLFVAIITTGFTLWLLS